jgi:hypothetical protein
MGLDMYAHTLHANLVPRGQATDVNITELALQAVGFTRISAEDRSTLMNEEAVKKYWADENKALSLATELGVYNHNFAYWRKFNALHGWMQGLYDSKGGTSKDFNCNNVRIESEDLDLLEETVKSQALKPVSGFFFGGETINEEDIEDLQAFIAKARQAIALNQAVFYDSWW